MLKADRIELAILNLLIDWYEPSGRWFNSLSMRDAISTAVDGVSQSETIDAVLILIDNGIIAFHGIDGMPYSPDRHERAFYGPDFRCKALPAARRRQQELSRDNRQGIFISHINEESAIAKRMKTLFQTALSNDVPVFVSSDFVSIDSGDPWYDRILEAIRKTQVVDSLLSPASN